jgi:hypothetical protein
MITAPQKVGRFISYSAIALLACLGWATNVPAQTPGLLLTCSLQKTGTEFKGVCEVPCEVNALAVNFDGIKPNFSCNTPPRRVTASLSKIDKTTNWLGTMEGVQPEDPTRFELVESTRVAKVPYGWFALQSMRMDENSLFLSISTDKQVPPTQDDIKILERARALLPDVQRWNKQDDRICRPNPEKWSLYCALIQATEEVSGGEHHYRQPALQAAREVVNEVGGKRVGKHRLMDYNNHPDTTLEEVHQLLRTAQERIAKRVLR